MNSCYKYPLLYLYLKLVPNHNYITTFSNQLMISNIELVDSHRYNVIVSIFYQTWYRLDLKQSILSNYLIMHYSHHYEIFIKLKAQECNHKIIILLIVAMQIMLLYLYYNRFIVAIITVK